MSARTGVVLVLGSLLVSAGLRAEPTPSTALLVLAKSDNTLAIVDPSTLKVVARVPVGPDPHEVIATADGRFAYVSNYGGGAYHTLAVVDLVEQKALPPVDLGALRGPHGLMFVGGKVWFTAEGAKVIGSYDPATKKVDLVLGTGQNRTHMIFVFEDLKRIITSNVSSATMTIIEQSLATGRGPGPGGPMGHARADWDETVVPVGRGAEGFDVSADGKEIWAANAQDGTVSIVDVAAKKGLCAGIRQSIRKASFSEWQRLASLRRCGNRTGQGF
jgi:YVTN family beta-propeller protein